MACSNMSSGYASSSLVDAFHGIPHRDIDLNDSPTEFELSLDYFEAVIIWACIPILICVCIFILMSVYLIFICCCCCCGDRKHTNKRSPRICAVLLMLLGIFALHWVVIGYLIVVSILIFLFIILAWCGIACASPVAVVIILIILFFLTFTMWVAVGGNLALLMVTSDVCVDPDTLVRNLTKNSVSPGVVNYYLVCDSACPSPLMGEFINATQALSAVETEEAVIRQYLNTETQPDLLNLLNVVVDGFSAANMTLVNSGSCVPVHEDYLNLLDSACGEDNAFLYSIILFAMACGLAISLMLLIICGSFHAGTISASNVEDEETIAYDFPPDGDAGAGVWEAYGTQQSYAATRPGQYTQVRESFNLTPTSAGVANEPPQYTDVSSPDEVSNGHRTSGQYDHFNT